MMPCMTFFSEQLKKHIESLGLNAYAVKDSVKVHPQYWYKLLRGEVPIPKDETLYKIVAAEELGLTFDKLKKWRMVDHYSPDYILEVAEMVKAERAQEGDQ